MKDPMYQQTARVAFKGQFFSAPMDWNSMAQQIKDMEKETKISLPIVGAVLATRVRLSIAAGLVDLNELIKDATVRRNVVAQLIQMHKDSGHLDCQDVHMPEVVTMASELADDDTASIPKGLIDILHESGGEDQELGVDKAATPAECMHTQQDLAREMKRARPSYMLLQRDSDVNKEVEASRASAFSDFPISNSGLVPICWISSAGSTYLVCSILLYHGWLAGPTYSVAQGKDGIAKLQQQCRWFSLQA